MKGTLHRLAPTTLRGRLALVSVTAAALLLATLSIVFNAVAGRHLRSLADDRLHSTLAAVASTIDVSGNRVHVREAAHDAPLDSNVWIYDGRKPVERPSAMSGNRRLTQTAGRMAREGTASCTTLSPAGHSPGWRLCAEPVSQAQHAVVTVAALDMAPYTNSADLLLGASAGFGAVMLACTYLLTRLSVARALRPVAVMTDQAAQWSAVSSASRFATTGAPQELLRLGGSLDALLDRIRSMLRHEQQLTAELSHELRTPLARIVGELELWQSRARDERETRHAQRVIQEAAVSMQAICDALLNDSRAATAHGAEAPGTCLVGIVLARVADGGGRPGVRTEVEAGSDVRAGVPDAVLERIVSPLQANALRYAASTVTLSARATSEGVTITVDDDGPGVPSDFVPHLFVPGRRADLTDGHDGAGLGLALVMRLTRSVGGQVWHEEKVGSGSRFVAEVPG
ncbi:HAMP domain-containing histidine kinase [Streptomyces sp. SID14478]|uniref:sensor histidine kinase n=1 Tax=Streptomyces sp. SID14478 TaxID=2706073 RepID=UPI0013D9BEEB|nr:HAMP domain-containing sensor histidine kinase [Streptomyces sp. SID14478]NEB73653.1 HAMP domain-containing histidine kinase [Streptomyces sp. SID14478]